MRIVRFAIDGLPKFGVLEDGSDSIVVLKSDPLFDKIEPAGQVLDLSEVRLLSPIIPRSKIIGTRNQDGKVSFFIKPNTTVIGPDVAVIKPSYAEKIYANANVGVVIKSLCKNVSSQEIDKYILGYVVVNDVSAIVKKDYPQDDLYSKGFDTSCVVGPWITVDPHLDPNKLVLNTFISNSLENEEKLSLNPKNIYEIVSEISKVSTLLPSDIVLISGKENSVEIPVDKLMRIDIQGIGSISNMLVEDEED